MSSFACGLGCGVRDGISQEILEAALEGGIRYFDTSTFYPVGAMAQFDETLQRLGIDRGDVHISLKLWITELGWNRGNDSNSHGISMLGSYENFCRRFNVQKFDSLVIHWPLKVDGNGFPEEFIIEEIWPQLEQLVDRNVVSGIGVSNFNIVEMQRLLNIARIKPFSVQIEYNPFAHDDALRNFCHGNDIKVIGHSPFNFGWEGGDKVLFDDQTLRDIAGTHGYSIASIVLAWVMKKGVVPIPGTTRLSHLKEIVDAQGLDVLTTRDVERIDSLNRHGFHYTDMYDYFGQSAHKKYWSSASGLKAWIYNDQNAFDEISIYDRDFMPRVKEALTDGAGFVILPGIFQRFADTMQRMAEEAPLSSDGRWNGIGPRLQSVLNSSPDVIEVVDDPVLSLIVESLLGWDCKLDNISLSTSRPAPHNAVFGPHQDSPFDHRPGAPLPPPSYPIVIQVITAINEFREDNGPLYVIPHSHKLRQRVNLPWQGNLPNGQIPEGAVKAICPKGSAVVAIGHIWHGAFSNESSEPRQSMLVEFVCSIIDARDKFTSGTLDRKVLQTCSRRMVRLLNNGKLHTYDDSGILASYFDEKRDKIPHIARSGW